jgi:RNA polymerase sigma-70 factor (ECF subfamily)
VTNSAASGVEVASERALISSLLQRDESAFREIVSRHHHAMLRVATCYVDSPAIAEEVVQETWLAVLEGLHRFKQRSSLKTWIFRILVNRARTRGAREHRTVAVPAVPDDDEAPAVPSHRFLEQGHRWGGHWAEPPTPWSDAPAERALEGETSRLVSETVHELPPRQREVVTLRDIHGWTAEEVCDLLHLSEANQRVLLHRGRSRIRAALERYYAAAAS